MWFTAWDVPRQTNSPSEELSWTVIVFIIRVFELSFSTSEELIKHHGICNRVCHKNTLITIAEDRNSAGDTNHSSNYVSSI